MRITEVLPNGKTFERDATPEEEARLKAIIANAAPRQEEPEKKPRPKAK